MKEWPRRCGESSSIVSLDFGKAFGSVSCKIRIDKLWMYRLNEQLYCDLRSKCPFALIGVQIGATRGLLHVVFPLVDAADTQNMSRASLTVVFNLVPEGEHLRSREGPSLELGKVQQDKTHP
ncbi:hypothetical protein WISP_07670 [Willisornis vidua]|uniref:Uncharacterized protein n=1 Tax=Willisornis vidua TaxID=1566151 RepID=A0ABQ9DT25_9PASS|nr:hypothetical protein WISP_07670 [Willisornis vidua]